jgi:hypothetical protein
MSEAPRIDRDGYWRNSQRDEADVVGRIYLDGLGLINRSEAAAGGLGVALDLGDGGLGLLDPTVHEQPARALRQVLPDEQDDEAEHRADEEGHPPRRRRRQVVDDQQGENGGDEGAAPVGPVHRDVDATAVLRRDELVDRRVDGGVLATDAHTGDEPGGVEVVDPALALAGRQRGEQPAGQVDAEGDHEQVLATPLVGQSAEEQRTGDLAQQVDGADGERDRAGREAQCTGLADDVRDVAGDGDLEPVEHPGDAKSDDQSGVEPGPAHPVDAGGNQRTDGRLRCRLGSCRHVRASWEWRVYTRRLQRVTR